MSKPNLILTLDQGTTRNKVALFTLTGENVAQVATRNAEFSDDSGHWQSADAWWACTTSACRKLLRENRIDPKQIISCSVTGRAGAGIFTNSSGRIVYQPWLDARHTTHLKRILESFENLPLYAATLLSKLLWIRENDLTAYNEINFAMYAKDYLVYRLTGNNVTDPSSGPDALNWPEDVLDTLDINQVLLPQPMLPWEIAGALTQDAADSLAIHREIPVVVGAHDGICANTGTGAIQHRQFALTLGTHGVTRTVVSGRPSSNANRFYCFPPDKHTIGANALMAGRSLDWFLDQSSENPDRKALFREMDAFVGKSTPGAHGISFFPYLAGQISPTINRNRKASFLGESKASTRFDKYQAVMEGASFAIAESFKQVIGWTGPPQFVGVTGSGADSLVWVQMLANILQVDLSLTDASSEGRGAAVFAAMALKEYSGLEEAIEQMVHVSRIVSPERDKTDTYAALFGQWQKRNKLAGCLSAPSESTNTPTCK